jgi:hypothetical protein
MQADWALQVFEHIPVLLIDIVQVEFEVTYFHLNSFDVNYLLVLRGEHASGVYLLRGNEQRLRVSRDYRERVPTGDCIEGIRA